MMALAFDYSPKKEKNSPKKETTNLPAGSPI